MRSPRSSIATKSLATLCLGLGLVLAPLPSRAAIAPEPSGGEVPELAPQSECRSASECLTEAEGAESTGQYVEAGQAYSKAFEKLRPAKQPANEGARIAMFCAEAYRMAFDKDGNVAHLDAADECLGDWLELAGPDSKATLGARVKTELDQLKAVRDPLKAAETARLAGDSKQQAKASREAIEAIKIQKRPWSTVAILVVSQAEADITIFDEQRAKVEVGEDHLQELEATKILLEDCLAQRPPDHDPGLSSRVAQHLEEIQARIDEATTALADTADDGVTDTPPPPPPDLAVAVVEGNDEGPRRRIKAIALLTAGGVVTAAGAAMLGEGVAFSSVVRRRGDAEQAKADELQQQYGSSYPRDEFDADLQRYRDEARARNIGLIAGGAVLLAGGLASGIAGAVLLSKKSRPKGPGAREKLALIPAVSRSQLQLSLTARF